VRSDPDAPAVTRATRVHRGQVVETVVAAFAADPAFRYFFPDPSAFDRDAGSFAGYLFDRRVDSGTVWVVDDGAAVAMWDAPGGVAVPELTLDVPGDVMRRLDAYHRPVELALPAEPHWYLGILATHPDAAGRGWGRAAMRPGLAEAAAAGLPACLETTNPGNVELYRRAGWEVTESLVTAGLEVWVMSYRGDR
jgi:ribosomal protein S18 acetylase RimI-like enzyme